jgi:hypothetical protein
MTWRERWNHLLVFLGTRLWTRSERELTLEAEKTVYERRIDGLNSFIRGLEAACAGLRKRAGGLEEVLTNALGSLAAISRGDAHIGTVARELISEHGMSNIVQIVQHNDLVGELTVLCRKPDGALEELHFDTSKPRTCPVPNGFRVLQIGAISPNIPFENPSSMGTLLANALRRFNDNVLRNPTFKGIVRDEGMHQDGQEGGTSTLLLELGQYKYDIVISERKGEVPDGAVADPKIVDPRAN